MDFYTRAVELNYETIANRRYLHENAEVGLDMPIAKKYIMEKLAECGIEPKDCGYGVTATIGCGGKVLLLRADMDALPMSEESGEDFACKGGSTHACGHDFHAAMLLTAAKMLKEHEAELAGTVKLMFQPAEETFEGSRNMIENGILENPHVDAALAFHVAPGKFPPGMFMYNSSGTMMNSVDVFRITISGKGAHGAYPQNAIDPINIGVHIYLALEALIAREADPSKSCVMTIGQFEAGTAANIIPDSASLSGTIRTNDKNEREKLVRRMKEIAVKTAEVFGGEAQITMISEVAPLICDGNLAEEMAGYMKAAEIPNLKGYPGATASASEDFASIAERVPAAFMYLSSGYADERGDYPAHNPKVLFDEGVCPIGAACYAHCAFEWLKNNH